MRSNTFSSVLPPCCSGLAAGSLAAELVVTRVMEFPFVLGGGAEPYRGGIRRARRHGHAGSCRHVHRTRPQTRAGAEKSLAGSAIVNELCNLSQISQTGASSACQSLRLRFLPHLRPAATGRRGPGQCRDNSRGIFHVGLRPEYRERPERLPHGSGSNRCGPARIHDIRVYNYMAAGVALTGGIHLFPFLGRGHAEPAPDFNSRLSGMPSSAAR